MPILYKAITAVLALTGCISLIITGELNLIMCTGGISIFAGYYRFFRGYEQASKKAAAVLAQVALFVFLTDTFVISGDVFLSVAHMTITFQGIKSFDLKEPWDHLQVYFMSLLQLIIASEMTRALAFGVIFVVFMLLLVTAMVLSHFLKEGSLGRVKIRQPVIMIALLTIISTSVLFVLIPRTPQRFFGKSHLRPIKTAGFSDRVDFGSFGTVKLDPTVVMRIELDRSISPPYYWRGVSLDHFDGRTWRATERNQDRIRRNNGEFLIFPYDRTKVVEQRIFLEPIDSDVIFGLMRMASVTIESYSLLHDSDQSIILPGKLFRRIRYSVLSDLSAADVRRPDGRYLRMPEGMDRISDLAASLTGSSQSDMQKARNIETYLMRTHTYSLTTAPPPPGMTVIEDFLFNSKKGYCEHYATSMVLMLRGIGIHSRIVNGYYGGEENEYGSYLIVRQSNAHSWVEAYIDGQWKIFDPTPAVALRRPSAFSLFLDSLRMQWTRYVIGFSLDDQKEIIRSLTLPFDMKRLKDIQLMPFISRTIVVVLAIYAVWMVIMLLKKLRKGRYERVTKTYLDFRRILSKRGFRIDGSMTAGDIRSALRDSGIREYAAEFLALYEEQRFGSIGTDPDKMVRYRELLELIKRTT